MPQQTSFSPIDLVRILVRLFDMEELETLCFELGVDFDSLPAQGKAGKARELVQLAERVNQLSILETAVRRLRPSLDTTYSPERTQQLQLSILEQSDDDVKEAFMEFTQQVEAYLNEFNLLHEQLEEWKEVHNLLQDLQNFFAPCRSYIYAFRRLKNSVERQQEEEKLLYQIEVEWRPCKRVLRRMEEFATGILAIGEPFAAGTDKGPDWYLRPLFIAKQLDRAIFNSDLITLRENLSEFGDLVDQYLYLADKELLKVANSIMRLPRPQAGKATLL